MESFLDSQKEDFFKSGIEVLQHFRQKYVDIEGIMLKNNTICLPKVKSLHMRLTIFQSALIIYYINCVFLMKFSVEFSNYFPHLLHIHRNQSQIYRCENAVGKKIHVVS